MFGSKSQLGALLLARTSIFIPIILINETNKMPPTTRQSWSASNNNITNMRQVWKRLTLIEAFLCAKYGHLRTLLGWIYCLSIAVTHPCMLTCALEPVRICRALCTYYMTFFFLYSGCDSLGAFCSSRNDFLPASLPVTEWNKWNKTNPLLVYTRVVLIRHINEAILMNDTRHRMLYMIKSKIIHALTVKVNYYEMKSSSLGCMLWLWVGYIIGICAKNKNQPRSARCYLLIHLFRAVYLVSYRISTYLWMSLYNSMECVRYAARANCNDKIACKFIAFDLRKSHNCPCLINLLAWSESLSAIAVADEVF